jgi:hypothetical protein
VILELRVAHRRIFVILAALLPTVYIAGLCARQPDPTFKSEDTRHVSIDFRPEIPEWWDRYGIAVRTKETARDVRLLEVRLTRPIDLPDPLLYWSREAPRGAELPATAILLGTLPAHGTVESELPERETGYLILYSLARGELAAVSRLKGGER